ncbi:uncharacterized protein LOC131875777 [Cryptomeria japonica]|uniref:uncharacterized protein LOC131875777 n=1 Tax=Cryptomeria japonica TaxID=3369 RepID=UPI0027DA6DE2|nr:uncharacterized protein LOC131875777 [Cryptomeria japonica]
MRRLLESLRKRTLQAEKPVKIESTSPEASSPKKKQTRNVSPSSGFAKSTESPAKPSSKGEKRKKDKITRVYVFVKDDEETESDEEVKKIKTKGTKATKVSKEKPSSEGQASKKVKTNSNKSDIGAEKRMKKKPERVYVVAIAEEETKSDEAVREVKKSATFSRVVKKQPTDEGQPSKKQKVEAEQSRRS